MNRRALIPRGGGRARRSGWLVAKADSNWTVDAHDRSIHKLRVSASQLTANQIARAHHEASAWLAAHQSAR